jgi:hypothetical protein
MPQGSQFNGRQILDGSIQEQDLSLGTTSPAIGAHTLPTDTTGFDNLLGSAEDTVQKALDTLDNVKVDGVKCAVIFPVL